MPEDPDPILEVVDALRADGVDVRPVGEELDRWQVGSFTRSDAEIWQLAVSRRLISDDDAR